MPTKSEHPGKFFSWKNAPFVDGREEPRPPPGYSAFDLGTAVGRRAPRLLLSERLSG